MRKIITINIILIALITILNSTINLDDLMNESKFDEAFMQMKNSGNQNIELWRKLGFFMKQENKITNAIYSYKMVLELDTKDYDAQLALARLYFQDYQYQKALNTFHIILDNDSTDVEALLGIARIFLRMEDYDKSLKYYISALEYLPHNVSILFELAKIYSYNDELNSAIETYKKILKIDDKNTEAFVGIGKMYWWKNQPYEALGYYKQAEKLDPANTKIQDEMQIIHNDCKWNLSLRLFSGNEQEESYKISYFQHESSLQKRLNDYFLINLSSNWKHARKTEDDLTLERNYDSNSISTSLLIDKNKLSYIIGGSLNDSAVTVSELNWETNQSINTIKLTNTIGYGEQYFYFWEIVRKYYLYDNFNLKWKNLKLVASYETGEVRQNQIRNQFTKRNNLYLNYYLSSQMTLFNIPEITVSGIYRYMDYMNESSLYYSPSNRKIYGLSASLYYIYNMFYFYGGYGFYQDNFNDSESNYDLELGWNLPYISISFSLSDFENSYYQSDNISLNIGGNF